LQLTKIKLFSSDIDGTLIGQNNAFGTLKQCWTKLDEASRPLLCYNTGRLNDDTLGLIESGALMEPDYIISGVGTCIYDFRQQRVIKEFSEILEEGWNLEKVEEVILSSGEEISKQPSHFQNPYKSSWFLKDAEDGQIDAIRQKLDEAGLDVHVVYSSSLHLDVLPKWANKGNALKWLLRHLALKPAEALVAGDSGNDSAMFLVKGIQGIVVGNAQPELKETTQHLPFYFAEPHQVAANAVIEGLKHFNIFSEELLNSRGPVTESSLIEQSLKESIRLSDGDIQGADKEQRDFIRVGYQKAIEALEKNITPLGFSACSLHDNETNGTDENYKSVWGRDGAIT
jgi:sucrose-6F-phosphate phosphohydrolase